MGPQEPLVNDKDVFGDGSVIVLNTPGHTPGHHSLLVKLPQMGAVIIAGDAAHFRENYDSDGVPWFNYDRAHQRADRLRDAFCCTGSQPVMARSVDAAAPLL